MLIKIETDFLTKYDLHITDYIVLWNIETNTFNDLSTLISEEDIKESVDYLLETGWLIEEDGKITLSSKYQDTFSESSVSKRYEKLYFTYPQKVFRKRGGFRVLRAATKESTDYHKCLGKYLKIVRSQPWLCDTIQTSLENQLQVCRSNEGLEFLQEFEVWLNNNTWEKYITIQSTEVNKNNERTHGI